MKPNHEENKHCPVRFTKPSAATFGLNLIGSLLGMKRTVDLAPNDSFMGYSNENFIC